MAKRHNQFDSRLTALFAFVFLLSTPRLTALFFGQSLFAADTYLTHRIHVLLLLVGWYAVIMAWPQLNKKLGQFRTWFLLPSLVYAGMFIVATQLSHDWYFLMDIASLAAAAYFALAFGLYAKQRLLATVLLLSCSLLLLMGITKL